jgi:hypothetical protein
MWTEGQGKIEGRKQMRIMSNSVTLKFRGGGYSLSGLNQGKEDGRSVRVLHEGQKRNLCVIAENKNNKIKGGKKKKEKKLVNNK